MQKKQTTTSTLSNLAEYEAPQVVCLSVEIEGVLASSRPQIGFGDNRPGGGGDGGGDSPWGFEPGKKPSDEFDY